MFQCQMVARPSGKSSCSAFPHCGGLAALDTLLPPEVVISVDSGDFCGIIWFEAVFWALFYGKNALILPYRLKPDISAKILGVLF